MRFERCQEKTVLTQCRFRLPLQVLAPAELADGTPYVMLLNPTGGMVGGDVLRTNIIQGSDTQLCLTTPSATRVYRTNGPAAVQDTLIRLGERAFLEYLPDHVIPHRNSRLRQKLRLEAARGSCAILWDAMAAGRVAHGERWKFSEFDSRIEVFVDGRPVFLNRTWIVPDLHNPECLGLAEEFSYLVTLVIISDNSDACSMAVASINELVSGLPEIWGGASLLAHDGCVVKLLARSASDLVRAQTLLWLHTRQTVFQRPAVDLRKY